MAEIPRVDENCCGRCYSVSIPLQTGVVQRIVDVRLVKRIVVQAMVGAVGVAPVTMTAPRRGSRGMVSRLALSDAFAKVTRLGVR
jgi:hypothetical protein